jgi:PAT family beta-lactamase induction signal transducer AmpG
MSAMVSPLHAAAQYALLSSLYALPGKVLGGFSGFAAAKFGYSAFFIGTSCIGLPVAALCLAVWRAYARNEAGAQQNSLA